jgi:CheY-like chemotaxis protein
MLFMTTLLWGIPAIAAFSLLILLIRSQDKFASVTRGGWTRMITGSVLLFVFCLTLFLLHLPVVELILGPHADSVALGAYLLFALGLSLVIPAAVGWLSDISVESAKTRNRVSSVSLTEDLLSLTEQAYVLTELLTAGLGTLKRHTESQAGMVWLLAQDQLTLILAGSVEFGKPALKAAEQVVASGHELFDRALKGRSVVTAGDLASRAKFLETFPGMDAYGAVAMIPLSAGGDLIGMVLLAAAEPYHFTPELVRNLEGAGRVLGSAVAGQRAGRHISKLEKQIAEKSRALDHWERLTGDGMPASIQSLLDGLLDVADAKAAYLVSRGGRHVEFATSGDLQGLPMEGIWSEAQATSDAKQRALWVSPGTRSNDPRSAFGRWIALSTPAGHFFFAPGTETVTYTPGDLTRLGKAAEFALLLAPAPEVPEPDRLLEMSTEFRESLSHPEALAELVAELIPAAESVLVWKKSDDRLSVAAASGCDPAPLAKLRLAVGQGAVGKAALAVQPFVLEAQAELGRSWAEYSETDRRSFSEAFGGLERPAAEYIVPVPHSDLILHLVRFTRGGWTDQAVRLAEALVRSLGRTAGVSATALADSVSASVANDLNNVFTGILGQSELLKRQLIELGLPAAEQERLEKIIKATLDGTEMVRKLATEEDSNRDPSLSNLTADVLAGRHITDDLYLLPDNRAIQIQQILDETPAFPSDGQKLQGMLWNALTSVARERTSITVGTSSDDKYSYLAVGSEENTEPLKGPFGDFFRAPDLVWSGTLPALDLDFLRSAGAQIAADNQDHPRRLVIRFPHEAHSASGALGQRGLHVLAIDDQEIIRDLLLNMFMGMGHRIKVCSSGEEGLDALQKDSFDLVLTDLGMPGMNGWEVATAVKQLDSTTPVVLITGWGFNFAEEQVRRAGVDYVLTKPFRLEHLTEVVDAAVRRSPQVH